MNSHSCDQSFNHTLCKCVPPMDESLLVDRAVRSETGPAREVAWPRPRKIRTSRRNQLPADTISNSSLSSISVAESTPGFGRENSANAASAMISGSMGSR